MLPTQRGMMLSGGGVLARRHVTGPHHTGRTIVTHRSRHRSHHRPHRGSRLALWMRMCTKRTQLDAGTGIFPARVPILLSFGAMSQEESRRQ